MSDLRTIIIDGQSIDVDPSLTILQACEQMETEIPRFCYHERLSIAGNCRMCLVEVVGGPPKPTASCAAQIRDLRPGPNGEPPEIRTNSPMVKKAREGVMEFMLINHPLDCPICDQGGECDLQDQAMAYGVDFSRYKEPKRAATELNLGPLVSTAMTRCISCTRCVRFTTEIAGIYQMGQTGRGEDSEIASYLEESLHSNLQGNIVDLCPVGALTSKPYAFRARPWELTPTLSIDVMDALGSNIRIDAKGLEVMRILPVNHDEINEEWLSDKARHCVDGLKNQRLDQPYIRKDGKLVPVSWDEALAAAAEALKSHAPLSLAGDLASCEAIFALGAITDALGGVKECRIDDEYLPKARGGYVGNAKIDDIQDAQYILLIGADPRNSAPVLNARIRKAWLKGAHIGLIGDKVDLTYDYVHLGNNPKALNELSEKAVNAVKSVPSLIILGQSALTHKDGEAVLAEALQIAENTQSKILILHEAASRVGAMDLGFLSDKGLQSELESAKLVYSLGADQVNIPDEAFVIYQGSHGDKGAQNADIILPSACYTEENGVFVNTEGRPQRAYKAVSPPGLARENWAIFSALAQKLGIESLGAEDFPTRYEELSQAMVKAVPHLGALGNVAENALPKLERKALSDESFAPMKADYYLTNPIARASAIMAQLSLQSQSMKEAAE